MQSRFLKKIIYGSLYLIILSTASYSFYIAFRGAPSCFDNRKNQGEAGIDCGGPCEPCALKNLKPIQTSPVSTFDIGNGNLSFLVQLRNLNVDYGANKFSYKVTFYGSEDRAISSFAGTSFIYPGEIKYLAEAGLDVDHSLVLRSGIELFDFSWQPLQVFSLPQIQTRNVSLEYRPQTRQVVISGRIVNQNSFSIPKANIIGILENSSGSFVGVSKTSIQDINPFEETSFSITFAGINESDLAEVSPRVFVESSK